MGEVERNVLDLQGSGLYTRPSFFGEDWDWLNEAGLPTYIGRWGKLYCSTLRAILLRMITYIGRIGEQYRSVSLLFRGDIVAFVVGGYRSLGGVVQEVYFVLACRAWAEGKRCFLLALLCEASGCLRIYRSCIIFALATKKVAILFLSSVG